jgi:hypothetical protein
MALGVLVARRILRPEDRKPSRLIAGAAVGGGAGLLGGQFLKAYMPDLSESDDPRQQLAAYYRRARPTGDATPEEVSAVNKVRNIYPKGVTMGRTWNPVTMARRELMLDTLPELEQAKTHFYRAHNYDAMAQQAGSPEEKQDFLSKAKASQDSAGNMNSTIRGKKLVHGALLPYDIVRDYVKNMVGVLSGAPAE